MKNKCVCRDELCIESTEPIYVHLSWCPESYVYKKEMAAYNNAPFWRKLFMYNPKNHTSGY